MRILIVSNLFPPVARGGYELECGAVAGHLAGRHDVTVLTSAFEAGGAPLRADVRRELPLLRDDARGALLAPAAALRGVAAARRALAAVRPELVYVWNGAAIPHAALRVLADSGVPIAFRVCEHWFGGLFSRDQYMRELVPAPRSGARAAWATACRAFNRLPPLRLDPGAPLPTALSWNSQALRRAVPVPPCAEVLLERVQHPAPPHADAFAAVARAAGADAAREPEIVFLGRVTPYKGVSVAIEALARLRADAWPSARLVVAGPEDAGHGAELRGLAERLGVGGAISWRGPLPPEQAAATLASAAAMIVPSTWEEPFGLVAIEGALAGVPVVASDAGGVGEGLRDEEHALLFARGDAAAAAAALERVLGDPAEAAERAARARRRAAEFALEPYLAGQEAFVLAAQETLARAQPGVRPDGPG